MDYFARQEVARRRTWWLVVMFFAALAGIIGAVYFAIAMAFQAGAGDAGYGSAAAANPMWSPEVLLTVAGAVSLIVLGGTAYKLAQLRHGGTTVAEMLGGRVVNPATTQFHERRLLNVVEEMALASGVPVPPVYVMAGQMGINAFAAGYSIHDAVVGVTEGAMRGLKREELQGVIAHEFSHILNGDMRLNIRLIGIVHGLLVLAIVGRILVRLAGSGRRSSNKKDSGAIVFVLLGLALMIVGYAGYFFGGLIKRAVSRQREYLADASAVQFTRNPLGLAAALKKVGGLTGGGLIKNAHAEELSHLFFSDGIKRIFGAGSLFATHPPLAKRVKLLDPTFNGEFTPLTEDSLYLSGQEEERLPSKKADEARQRGREFIRRSMMAGGAVAANPMAMIAQAGVLDALQLEAATALLESVPADLRADAREMLGAQSIVLALLLTATSDEPSADAWAWLPVSFADSVGRHMDRMSRLPAPVRLVLIDLALPALRTLNMEQAERFLDLVDKIVRADQKINLFEFAAQEIVRSGLREVLKIQPPRINVTNIQSLRAEVELLINVMAYAGQPDEASAGRAFGAGLEALGFAGATYREPGHGDLDAVKTALDKMLTASMPVRKKFLEAAIACLMADGKININESELFRAFAAALEVPVPPGALAGDEA